MLCDFLRCDREHFIHSCGRSWQSCEPRISRSRNSRGLFMPLDQPLGGMLVLLMMTINIHKLLPPFPRAEHAHATQHTPREAAV
jgi:hypothetical protein